MGNKPPGWCGEGESTKLKGCLQVLATPSNPSVPLPTEAVVVLSDTDADRWEPHIPLATVVGSGVGR